MRLLQFNGRDSFSLAEFAGVEIPRYAILSHTWGADGEEVTFEDLKGVITRSKAGYEKLRFCAIQAASDGLQYFWVDTCCIDKSSLVELQHAINSMFRWYQNAARCYVYLSDVDTTEDDQFSQTSWEAAFRESRWFTRGWTLQELIAPTSVEFFSRSHIQLGDKKSLEQQIHETTRIPIAALQGSPLSHFTVEERMSWVEHRKTKYEEDKVYSLQGIFDVYIPLIYGEGWDRALFRLQREIQESSKAQAETLPTPSSTCMECLYSYDYQSSRAFNSDRVEGTCEWFLNTQTYRQWQQDQRAKLLWVSADPGCGKSVLASFLIEKLEQLELQKTVPGTVCYFFFKDNIQQNSALLSLRAMIHQIFTAKPSLIAIAVAELQIKGEKFVESFGTMWKIFTTAIASSGGNVICVLDGLDECEEPTRDLLIKSWATSYAQENQSNQVLKLIVTSRPQLSIERVFYDLPHMRLRFEDQPSSTSRDIELVVRARVKAIGERRGITRDVQTDLVNRLINNAGGTFLWACLILADIEKSARLSTAALRELLTNVPTTLDEMYEKILERSSNRQDAQTILHMVVAAVRPLTLTEMNVAFNITDQQHEELELEPNIHATIRELCGLFVKILNQRIYLIHQTAKDFLTKQSTESSWRGSLGLWKNSLHPAESHLVIAERCIWYLSMTLFKDRLILVDSESNVEQIKNAIEQCTKDHDFLEYAAKHWVTHFQAANLAETPDVVTLALNLCEAQTERFKTWFSVSWSYSSFYKMPKISTAFTAAVYLGLDIVVRQLIENGIDVNSRAADDYQTALAWAAAHNRQAVVTLLLENGADANCKDQLGRTPLWIAASRRNEGIVEHLLEQEDVDPNCIAGDTDSAQNSGPSSRGTPLWAAAGSGHESVVRILLARSDVNPNLSSDGGGTPFMTAVAFGHEDVVKLLLHRGVETRSGLVIAAQRSDSNIIQLLLEHGVSDVDSRNARGVTPLMRAAWCGEEANVRLLLEARANPNVRPDPDGELFRTNGSDREAFINSIIRVTLEEGFLMVEGSGKGAAIHEASITGHAEVVRLLLEYGADFEMKDSHGLTALRLAVANGHEAVARLLLEKGARDTNDMDGVTSLHTAALKGNESMVQLLLDNGAKMEATLRNEMAWTVLHCAAYSGHAGVVQILLKHNCDLHILDGYGHTAEYYAREQGHLAVVELLQS